ncbi:MAG: VWA domain-containing protein [Halobacteriaceae archaeon]
MSSEIPDFTQAKDHVISQVIEFIHTLRYEGASIPANAAILALESLATVGLRERSRVRAALRASLISDPQDREIFDEHFPDFWYRLKSGLAAAAMDEQTDGSEGDETQSQITIDDDISILSANSRMNIVGKGKGDITDKEQSLTSQHITEHDEEVDQRAANQRSGTFSATGRSVRITREPSSNTIDRGILRRFENAIATLPGRRWKHSKSGETIHARRALRESLDTGGIAVTLPQQEHKQSTYQLTILVDVSRSVIDAIDRGFLLSFLDGLRSGSRSVRIFFFDTDIKEVTDIFRSKGGDPSAALENAEIEWGGGTRIGKSLQTLNDEWPYAIDRQTITLVISDGLEVGDVATLKTGMSWMARRSAGILWLNPLATSTQYEPTCQGMQIATQYIDGLFAFGGNEDIAEIARQLEQHTVSRQIGYQHDFRDRNTLSS